jgi:hypothetical protein
VEAVAEAAAVAVSQREVVVPGEAAQEAACVSRSSP